MFELSRLGGLDGLNFYSVKSATWVCEMIREERTGIFSISRAKNMHVYNIKYVDIL
jgi:hypothetical protein